MFEQSRSYQLTRLKLDLEQAWRENVAARARFDAVMGETPQSIPHPDCSLRIRQAGTEMNLALQHYIEALRRYTDCVTNPQISGPHEMVLRILREEAALTFNREIWICRETAGPSPARATAKE